MARAVGSLIALAVIVLISGAAPLLGSDVYLVRFDTLRDQSLGEAPCTNLAWRDEIIFHNLGSTDAIIQLLGVSNGAPGANVQSLTLPSGITRSTEGDTSPAGTWAPDPQPLLWVAHLDVPDTVLIRSRALVPTYNICVGGGVGVVGNSRIYAGIPLPVVRSLTPAGSAQVLLGTDLGGDPTGFAIEGRINVGVYNAGAVVASASVELHRGCDGTVLATRSIQIPPNTIIQTAGLSAIFEGCTAINEAGFETYVVVTVDQPSFSYATVLSTQRPPWIPAGSAP